MQFTWKYDQESINWEELSRLYKIAPLGDKKADDLQKAFGNSMYKCFVFKGRQLVGVERAHEEGVVSEGCHILMDIEKAAGKKKQASADGGTELEDLEEVVQEEIADGDIRLSVTAGGGVKPQSGTLGRLFGRK